MLQSRNFAPILIFIGLLVLFCYGAQDIWLSSWTPFFYIFSPSSMSILGIYPESSMPDFGQYREIRTLGEDEFPIDDPSRKVIVVGDIHGKINPLRSLLRKVDYRPGKDVFIHTGDIVTRGPLKGSLQVLDFLATNNITGVRGNNDQMVVEWRTWFEWIKSRSGGLSWLERLERKWEDLQDDGLLLDLDDFLASEQEASHQQDKKWWQAIPKGWKPLSKHYFVARSMSADHMRYLLDLPLRLHAPHAHTFIVHAGILPYNPKWPMNDKRQPLAKLPKETNKLSVDEIRQLQEVSILNDIAQNKDPWTSLNLRSIIKNRLSKKAKKGNYWAKLWKRQMNSCVGYQGASMESLEEDDDEPSDVVVESAKFKLQSRAKKSYQLPCYPSTVIYGHTAARGTDIERWSFGLDSGCAYGRRLSALVISKGAPTPTDNGDEEVILDDGALETNKKPPRSSFEFGDSSEARIISVGC